MRCFGMRVPFVLTKHIIDGDVNQLDEETDCTHDKEPNGDCLRNAQELFDIGLLAARQELSAVPGELLRKIRELFQLFRHVVSVQGRC